MNGYYGTLTGSHRPRWRMHGYVSVPMTLSDL